MLTRRGLLLGGVAGLVLAGAGYRAEHEDRIAAAVAAGAITGDQELRRAAQPDGVFSVDTDQPLVAITFDDGPDPDYTPAVLAALSRARAKATFFVVGLNARAHPDLVAATLAGGHSIGNHTHDHSDLGRMPAHLVAAEIDRGLVDLRAVGVPGPRLFRPPLGHTGRAVRAAAARRGLTTVFWSECLEAAYLHAGPGRAALRRAAVELAQRVQPGSIVLCHDGGRVAGTRQPVIDRSRTVEALPVLLHTIRQLGMRPVDVPTLLAARA